MTTNRGLQLYANQLARNIEALTDATEYLRVAASIEYIVDKDRQFLGAHVRFVNDDDDTKIVIDTRRGLVEVFEWGAYARAALWSCDALNRALGELYNR
jgi:hypothetical protein